MAAETKQSERINEAFAAHRKRAALMPYVLGGFPDLACSEDCARAAIDNGADLIELGIPFSDPLADGPVIHSAGVQALRSGVRSTDVLRLCERVAGPVPICLMAYSNHVFGDGPRLFVRRAVDAGASGLIVPDAPFDETEELREVCRSAGLALVPMLAPTTPVPRVRVIAEHAEGFLYVVAVVGTTGERAGSPAAPEALIAEVRRTRAELPVAIGFGISTPDQAARAAAHADGVIIGTRMVRAAGENGAIGVGRLVAQFAQALSPGSTRVASPTARPEVL